MGGTGMELGIGAAGLIGIVVMWAVVLYVVYWVIRLGVRAGMMDAWKRREELERERATLRVRDAAPDLR